MKRKITINIDINWGSEFQMSFMEDNIKILLKAWKMFAESKHKDNKITYEIDTHDGYKVKQV
jgi:hypothetical protein